MDDRHTGGMITEIMQGVRAVGTGGMTTEIMQGVSAAWMIGIQEALQQRSYRERAQLIH